MTATVVLVHGAWSGAWTWNEVAKGLEERGIAVRAVDLPSCHENNVAIGFHEDGAHVRGVIDEVGGPVVLVGNSYGGVVISEAASGHPNVARLVYLAAFVPEPGVPPMNEMQSCTDPDFGKGISFRDDMLVEMDVEHEIRHALQQAPPDQVELVRANAGKPMSFGADPTASVAAPAWETIPSTYVVCSEDLSILPEAQREWAKRRATDFVEWSSDHCPQHSHPDLVVDLLARLAQGPA